MLLQAGCCRALLRSSKGGVGETVAGCCCGRGSELRRVLLQGAVCCRDVAGRRADQGSELGRVLQGAAAGSCCRPRLQLRRVLQGWVRFRIPARCCCNGAAGCCCKPRLRVAQGAAGRALLQGAVARCCCKVLLQGAALQAETQELRGVLPGAAAGGDSELRRVLQGAAAGRASGSWAGCCGVSELRTRCCCKVWLSVEHGAAGRRCGPRLSVERCCKALLQGAVARRCCARRCCKVRLRVEQGAAGCCCWPRLRVAAGRESDLRWVLGRCCRPSCARRCRALWWLLCILAVGLLDAHSPSLFRLKHGAIFLGVLTSAPRQQHPATAPSRNSESHPPLLCLTRAVAACCWS